MYSFSYKRFCSDYSEDDANKLRQFRKNVIATREQIKDKKIVKSLLSEEKALTLLIAAITGTGQYAQRFTGFPLELQQIVLLYLQLIS